MNRALASLLPDGQSFSVQNLTRNQFVELLPTLGNGLYDVDANLRADGAAVLLRICMRQQNIPFGPLGYDVPGNLDLDFPKPGSDLAGQLHDDLGLLDD